MFIDIIFLLQKNSFFHYLMLAVCVKLFVPEMKWLVNVYLKSLINF